ncbi:MAG: flagellar hook-basal body complex protein [Chloroflexi bacterium]|nr:flagellar hook-basal body complex protein [Chloroflexota bacterium]
MTTTALTALHVSVSAMLARQFEMDVISNNLANVNTTGYKPSRADFQELFVEGVPDNRSTTPYRGTGPGVTRRSTLPGALAPASSPLEMAIEGDGFFAVTQPDGTTAYTRDGRFLQDGANQLVTVTGQPVVWDGALPQEAEALHVNVDGTVMARANGQWTQVGAIAVFRFDNPGGLLAADDNLLVVSEASGDPAQGVGGQNGFGRIISGATENSAIDYAEEVTSMILAQRAYTMSIKAFQQTDEMMGMANRLRSG